MCLKKFSQSTFFSFKKSTIKIKIDSKLDLTPFVLHKTNGGLNKEYRYELYATVNHSGGLGGGHYTAHVKKNGVWYYVSDSHYQEVSQSRVLNSNPYMIFYKLI